MKKFVLAAGAAIASLACSGAAFAQESTGAHPYVGAQIGYHDLGISDEDAEDFDLDDSGLIYGAYAGVDFDIGTAAVIGIEGNFNLGNGPIDSDYGIAGRIGYRAPTGTVVFARAGYQWVNVDVGGLLDIDEEDFDDEDLDIDDTIGDWLVGVGADVAVGTNARIRVAVDTISFDTLRPTVGVNFGF